MIPANIEILFPMEFQEKLRARLKDFFRGHPPGTMIKVVHVDPPQKEKPKVQRRKSEIFGMVIL